MSAEILINVRPQETRVAYVEAGVLSEFKIERKTSPTLVGSIHRGKVIRVLPGMQAAFVDIGLEKAAFLYVGDIREDFDEGYADPDRDEPIAADQDKDPSNEPPKVPIQELLTEGQHILVQVAKDPIGTKGARLTTHISLPGRFIVYLPTVRHLGISRRIESEEERERLKQL
ncbi:MAG: Rne/Rng family ribonuclease, partial [Bdellovibrio sp. CG10_big_fil_rev_8_21_14_0_10_47_8]